MKTLVAFLAFVALVTFGVMEFTKVNSLTREINALKAAGAPEAAGAPVQETTTRIVCPACNGEKVIMLGQVPHRTVQNCPVCGGVGYRILQIRAGMSICPDCQGMGVVYEGNPAEGIAVTTYRCPRCTMSGLIATGQ